MMPSSQMRAVAKYGWPSRSKLSSTGCLKAASSAALQVLPSASMFSRLTVASTPAACGPPITEMRALGQVNRKRGE